MAGRNKVRMTEMLRGIAVEAIDGTLGTPHTGGDKINAYFERRCRMESTELLEQIAREGVAVAIWPVSWRMGITGLRRSMEERYKSKQQLIFALGKALLFLVGLRIPSVRVAEKEKTVDISKNEGSGQIFTPDGYISNAGPIIIFAA